MRAKTKSIVTGVLLLAGLCVFAVLPTEEAKAFPPGVVMLTEAELAALPPFPADLVGGMALGAIPPGVTADLMHTVPAAPATSARNAAFTCPPAVLFNPDAGVGLVPPSDGYNAVNIEVLSSTATTTKFYLCWRNGTTKTNWATVCRERGTGSMYGGSYRAEVTSAARDLFCLASVSGSDAGAAVTIEFAK